MEVVSSATEPMRIQFLALFELVAVRLTAGLSVEHLTLKTRGAKMRLNLPPAAPVSGITFQSAQVLLDRSARMT